MRLLAALVILSGLGPTLAAQDGGSVLVFSRTTGFHHASIGAGIDAVRALGQEHRFTVVATENPGAFSAAGLAAYDAVVFLNTTGDVLNTAQQAAFEDYIRADGDRPRDAPIATGPHHVVADLSPLPSGVYVVRLTASGGVRTRSLAVMR